MEALVRHRAAPQGVDTPALRQFDVEDDLDAAKELLRELPQLYPSGDAWLDKRLHDPQARIIVVADGRALSGIVIITPKTEHRAKLSTLFVAEGARRRGVGRVLLRAAHHEWTKAGFRDVYVTVAESRRDALAPLIERHGFRLRCIGLDRYGPGRHEHIFVWSADDAFLGATWEPSRS